MSTIEGFRLSEKERDQLVKLKRVTGLKNWNVLCRWAFCLSIADPTAPAVVNLTSDSTVEMTWKTFGNPHQDIYLGLLKMRMMRENIELSRQNLERQFRLHLHRGLNRLSADQTLRSISSLVDR